MSYIKKIPRRHLFGFTLVELIVVIAVLAVLSSIAYTSVQNITSSARDAKRMTSVTAVSDAFNIALSQGKAINTSDTSANVNIEIDGTSLALTGYYGKLNNSLLDSIKAYGTDLVSDAETYDYTYFPTKRVYQVRAFLENQIKRSAFMPLQNAFADSTGNTYVFVKGNLSATGGVSCIMPHPSSWASVVPNVNGVRVLDAVTNTLCDGISTGVTPLPAAAGNSSGFAWNESVGWIDFSTVSISGLTFTGSAWSENMGWIDFTNGQAGSNLALTSVAPNKRFTGKTWGENAGWVNFNTDATNQVYIDASGNFHGKAWSENLGWITFDPADGATVKTL